jgi:glycine dehydrogenase subunit 1
VSYLPHTAEERSAMLKAIGVGSVDELFANVPEGLRSGPPNIGTGLSEQEVVRLLDELQSQNLDVDHRPSFLGGGAYNHYVPSAVAAITGRSEFYTSYTPYQPEVSQGTLQVIYEFQTMIAELMALDVSNASLYDMATAVAEACTIAINETRRNRIVVAGGLHPDSRQVLATYMAAQGFECVHLAETWTIDTDRAAAVIDDSVAGVVVQSPNFWGAIEPMRELCEMTHEQGALFIAAVNPLSLALLEAPGEYGADVGVGCGQPFGIPLSFGGPYLGLIAVREGLARRLPGRIAGATEDANGRKGYVLTLQAREQHIRREKATSNICTNHQLMALATTVYLSLLGKRGLRKLATLCLQRAHYAAEQVSGLSGFEVAFGAPFFNEFTVKTPLPAAEINRHLLMAGIVGGLDLGQMDQSMSGFLTLAVTEMNDRQQIDDLVETLRNLEPAEGMVIQEHLQGAGAGARA